MNLSGQLFEIALGVERLSKELSPGFDTGQASRLHQAVKSSALLSLKVRTIEHCIVSQYLNFQGYRNSTFSSLTKDVRVSLNITP